jgi:hyaluronoglucosaminidase
VTEAAILLCEDEAARHVADRLRSFLFGVGVKQAPIVATTQAAGRYSLVIALGDPSNDPRLAEYWQACSGSAKPDISSLGPQGYALITCRKGGRGFALICGSSEKGLAHGSATFRQLLFMRGKQLLLRQVQIADRPGFDLRGVAEWFYGPPWSHAQRLRVLSFEGDYKLDLHVYGPKEEPLHRQRWREPYPQRQLREFRQLAQAARASGVRFFYAISPGLSICYSSRRDFAALCQKLESLRGVGVRDFGLFLDDIPPELQYKADRERFGSIADAQSALANRLLDHLRRRESEVTLLFCPTEYTGAKGSGYLDALGQKLSPDIAVLWTGQEVCSPCIEADHARGFGAAVRRKPLICDNYPVNDYDRRRLFLGPLLNRSADLSEAAGGLLSNPMNEAEASRIALLTIADYTWNPHAYEPLPSWRAAVMHVGGPRACSDLESFAQQNMSSFLDGRESPSLWAAINELWKEWPSGKWREAALRLDGEFRRLGDIARRLPNRLAGEPLLSDLEPYLGRLKELARLGQAAVAALRNEERGRQRLANMLQATRKDACKVCGEIIQTFAAKVQEMKR